MKTFNDLTENELDLTVDAAMAKADLSEDELQAVLEHLDREQDKHIESKESGIIDQDFKTLLAQTESYFQMGKTLPKGLFGNFWKKFNDKAKDIICKNEEIIDFMNGNSHKHTLKGTLKTVIPWVISALGISALTPLTLAIVIGALAYLSKIGFNAYCEI